MGCFVDRRGEGVELMAEATNKRKTTGSRRNTTKKTSAKSTAKKSTAKNGKVESTMGDEILLIIALGISIIMILSTFDLCGKVGYLIAYFIFGVFGLMAYLIPYMLFLGTAFYVSNKQNKVAKFKIFAAVIISVALMAFIQLISNSSDGVSKLLDYYRESALYRNGGGIIGGLVVRGLHPLFGTAGTYVIVILLFLIGIILVTEKAVFASLGKKSKEAYQNAANNIRERRILKEKEKEELQKEKEEERIRLTKLEADHNIVIPKVELPKEYETEILPDNNSQDDFEITVTHMEPITEPLNIDRPISMPTDIDIPMEVKEDSKKKTKKESALPLTSDEITEPIKQYVFPPIELLRRGKSSGRSLTSDVYLKETAMKLQSTLDSFGVRVQVTNVSCGPSVTRYELQPEQGVKVSKIVSLADDIKLNLAVADIRIEAPIPGKAAVGIEVPNKENTTVMLRDLLETPEFKNHKSEIAFAAGRDIGGQVIVADIAKMPHLLIAGATGSGKSVCINTLIMSIIYKAKPEDVRLIMIDPKVVELSIYNDIPHLLIPVVTDPKKAAGALNWAVAEMEDRYKKFAQLNVRDLKGYNDKIKKSGYESEEHKKMPQIVIIIDELADLMMVAPGEVEDAICRLAQLARAAGLHLVIATQRPSVNVITGLIKANIPSRIAFSVSSGVDSRTIIDMNGAEKLLGKGDMLFYPAGHQKPQRVQGAFVSDKEVNDVVEFLKAQSLAPQYNEEITDKITTSVKASDNNDASNDRDVYFTEAGRFIIEKDKASIGMLQRVYKIGFNRAARIMDQLSEAGVVGPEEGTKPRKILMSEEEFERFIEESV